MFRQSLSPGLIIRYYQSFSYLETVASGGTAHSNYVCSIGLGVKNSQFIRLKALGGRSAKRETWLEEKTKKAIVIMRGTPVKATPCWALFPLYYLFQI